MKLYEVTNLYVYGRILKDSNEEDYINDTTNTWAGIGKRNYKTK